MFCKGFVQLHHLGVRGKWRRKFEPNGHFAISLEQFQDLLKVRIIFPGRLELGFPALKELCESSFAHGNAALDL